MNLTFYYNNFVIRIKNKMENFGKSLSKKDCDDIMLLILKN